MANAEVLFAEHRDGVFRYLSRIVGHADTAQDLTQEVFLRVARVPVPDAEAAGRRAWVFKIARNLALNHIRDCQRRPELAEETDAGRPATQELGAALSQALGALPDLDRDVFLMRESAGLTYQEIATACELTPDAVRSRLHRARQQLRAALSGPIASECRAGLQACRDRRT